MTSFFPAVEKIGHFLGYFTQYLSPTAKGSDGQLDLVPHRTLYNERKLFIQASVTIIFRLGCNPAAEGSTGASPGTRRKRLVELMHEKNLVFVDPARDRLATTLSEITEGFVGSDLESICREAGMLALREDATTVTRRHFEEAQKKVHPMMNDRLREYYKNIQQHFKGGLPKQVQPPEYQ